MDGWDKEKKPIKVPLGQLIYAGGDDVVCLVPADAALSVARALRVMFRWRTRRTPSTGNKPDASAGIAIAHIHSPLQDLIREAQKAEKRAKNEVGRPAFSVTLMKRSGEISHWGSKWNDGGITLNKTIANLMDGKKLSAKFPHRVIELLEPYLTTNKGLSKQTDAIDSSDTTLELIQKEFAHAATRQGSKLTPKESENLKNKLKYYLRNVIKARKDKDEKLKNDNKPAIELTLTQELLISLIGLCTTVAFAHRTKSEEKSPNR